MRVIVIGCEYSGVTTLIDGLMAWGDERGILHHLDDHLPSPTVNVWRLKMRRSCST